MIENHVLTNLKYKKIYSSKEICSALFRLSPKVEPPLPCQLKVDFLCFISAKLWLIVESFEPSQEYFLLLFD